VVNSRAVARRARLGVCNAQKLLRGLARVGLVEKVGERGGWRLACLTPFPEEPPPAEQTGEKSGC
jgi:hypothetical protein